VAGQHLFAELDRSQLEYRNSAINLQYVYGNEDIYRGLTGPEVFPGNGPAPEFTDNGAVLSLYHAGLLDMRQEAFEARYQGFNGQVDPWAGSAADAAAAYFGFQVEIGRLSQAIQTADGLTLPEHLDASAAQLYMEDISSAGQMLGAAATTRYVNQDSEGLSRYVENLTPEERAFWVEIRKEDLFYYIYGLLHSPDYRARYKNNLAKALPRIPAVKTATDFWAFSKAGRALGDVHVNFEHVKPYMVTFKEGDHALIHEAQNNPQKFYRVKKMKFAAKGKEKDRSSVIYNEHITLQNIPLEAYDYVVNGKPALEWVMERQVVKTDKDSGIVNDANDYAIETIGDPRYPLDLFRRVITVSMETQRIVANLPELEID